MSLLKKVFWFLLGSNKYHVIKPQLVLEHLQSSVTNLESVNLGTDREKISGLHIVFETFFEVWYSYSKFGNGEIREVIECSFSTNLPSVFVFTSGRFKYVEYPSYNSGIKWPAPDTVYEQHANLMRVRLKENIRLNAKLLSAKAHESS